MKISHIYWFAYYDLDEPSVRYRGLYQLQHLQDAHNITHSIVYPGYSLTLILNFIRQLCMILLFRRKDSVIVFENIRTDGIYSTLLKVLLLFRKKNTLYDIDDADYLRFPPASINYFMKHCSACAVGSIALKQYASQFNDHTFLITSPIIDHNYRKGLKNPTLTVGWIGYYEAHKESLKTLFFPALRLYSGNIELVILGVEHEAHCEDIHNYFAQHTNVVITIHHDIDWFDEHSIYSIISGFDVGVSPLLDNEFNRAKSAFKMKQYLSCGVPVLASPVGENNRFLRQDHNGYFCDTPADYLHYLAQIDAMSEEQYRLMSGNAANTQESFSMQNGSETMLAFYNDDRNAGNRVISF